MYTRVIDLISADCASDPVRSITSGVLLFLDLRVVVTGIFAAVCRLVMWVYRFHGFRVKESIELFYLSQTPMQHFITLYGLRIC